MVTASWYGPGLYGRRTSSGEILDGNQLTAASRSLPMGSRVKVTNPANGRSVVVRINDRGPYLKGRGIDLSHAAAKRIGLVSKGVGRVRVAKTNGGPVEPAAGTVTGSIHDWRIRSSRLQRRHHARRRIVSNPIGHWLFSALR